MALFVWRPADGRDRRKRFFLKIRLLYQGPGVSLRLRIMKRIGLWLLGMGLGVVHLAAKPDESANVPADLQQQLNQDGFVITDRSLRQGFSAYIRAELPPFITSDSLLMAYTTLLQKVEAEQQIANWATHIELLAAMARQLPKRDEAVEGVSATRLLVGSAYRILYGKTPDGLDDDEMKIIEAEALRVEQAKGMHPPGWWQSSAYMPYSRFVPTLSWSETESLKRYYRYYQWMQSMPVDGRSKLHREVCYQLYQILDTAGHRVVSNALDDSAWGNVQELGVLQSLTAIRLTGPGSEELQLRKEIKAVLSSKKRLLQPQPTIEKAWLDKQLKDSGSLSKMGVFVGDLLSCKSGKSTQNKERYKEWQKLLAGSSSRKEQLFFEALLILNEKAEEQAPEIFQSEAWRKKQLNCSLGAWAEYRYAVAIHQTTSAHYLGRTEEEVGYVEPVPRFYRALSEAAELMVRRHEYTRKNMNGWQYVFILDLERLSQQMKRAIEKRKGGGVWLSLGGGDYQSKREWEDRLDSMFKVEVPEGGMERAGWSYQRASDLEQLVTKMDRFCDQFWAGKREVRKSVNQHLPQRQNRVSSKIYQLALLCLKLEQIATKQLGGLALEAQERKLIEDYGKILARIMFHEGNSYLSPKDNSPKIVQIAHLGEPGREQILSCGTARPRLMLIEYPDAAGNKVLCQGAVYTYREERTNEPITGADWKNRCQKTESPDWIQLPVYQIPPPPKSTR